MKGRRKMWTLGLTGMAIAAIIVLAVSLSNLKLRGAQPFSLGPVLPERSGLEPPPASAGTVGVAIRALLIIAGVFLPFAIIYYIVSPEARRRVLRDLCFLLAVLLPVYLLMWARPAFLKNAGEVRLLETSPQDLRLPPKVAFVLFVGAAAFGLGQDLPSGWMLLGLVAALSAWDLAHFAHLLDGAEGVEQRRLLERRHLRRLLIVDGLGLLLGGAALTVQIQLGFGLVLLLGLLALLGLSRAVRFLRREGG